MGTSTTPKPRRGDTRSALIDAAHAVVRRKGWSATSVDELCAAAGVTKGAFFHHFASKQALGIAAVAAWSDRAREHIFENPHLTTIADPLDRVFAHIDLRLALLEGHAEDYSCFVGTVIQEAYATSDPLREAGEESLTAYADRLADDIAEAIATHRVVVRTDALSLAFHVQAVLQGAFILAKSRNDPALARDTVAHLKRYVQMLFGKEPTP